MKTDSYIGGHWTPAVNGARFAVIDPARNTEIAQVAACGAEETRRAVAAAEAALPGWRRLAATDRATLLRRWFDLIEARAERLAALITAEQGKPIAQARREVVGAAAYVAWYAEEAKRAYGTVIPSPLPGRRLLVTAAPVGVVAAITPWNFPLAMVARKCAPALAAGCPVVVKPAEQTPLSALALAELAEAAGFPPGVFNVLTGPPAAIGATLCTAPQVRLLSFTGSTEVGKALMRACAGTLKRLSLELGGNAPLLVLADADLDRAVAGALESKFRNSGQTCVSANRILVDARRYDAFVARFASAAAALPIGPGDQDGVEIGPLIDAAALAKNQRLLADAKAGGARLLCGATPPERGFFVAPTVLAEARPTMAAFCTEIFGPVAPIYRVADTAAAVALANRSRAGLSAYVFGRDATRLRDVAAALEYGVVGINVGSTSNEAAPFGGIKESGQGREGGPWGLAEYLSLKTVHMGGIDQS